MKVHVEVAKALDQLAQYAASWEESASNLQATGSIDLVSLRGLTGVLASFATALLPPPNLRVDGESCNQADLSTLAAAEPIDWPANWQLTLDKSRLLDSVRPVDEAYIFLTLPAFLQWSERLSPLNRGTMELTGEHTYLFVQGLSAGFGGPRLAVLPITAPLKPPPENCLNLPSEADVLKVVHVISGYQLLMDPTAIALTWGDRNQAAARSFRRLSAMVAGLSIVQDVYARNSEIQVVLRGTRRVELPLADNEFEDVTSKELDQIYTAAEWVFAEREETRHKLLTDRLSIDIRDETSLLTALRSYLAVALKQAKERYGFVILDRKDAYHKELRDLMKDVRAQADLYAAKVRDLVSALSRDTLAVLFMIGVSLVARAKSNAIEELLSSTEVQIFFKVLAGYFVVSIVLQGASHWRDISLAKKEGSDWHTLTREYVPQGTFQTYFEDPRKRRHRFFMTALLVCALIYACLAYLSWNIATVYETVLKLIAHGHPS